MQRECQIFSLFANSTYDCPVHSEPPPQTSDDRTVILAFVPVEHTPFGEPVRAHVRHLIRAAIEQAGRRCVDAEITSQADVARVMEQHLGALVFNLCYGLKQANGPVLGQPDIARWFEAAGAHLIGSGSAAQALCQDKLRAGEVAKQLGIAAPEIFELEEALLCAGPLLVKPREGAAHRGIRIIDDPSDLRSEPPARGSLIQEYLDGPEYTIGILGGANGPRALPLVRVRYQRSADRPAVYEWTSTSMAPDSPNRFGIADAARSLFDALELEDYARFDFRAVRGQGPVLMDANALPNLAPRQLFAVSARWAGVTYPGLIAEIVDSAAQRCEAMV